MKFAKLALASTLAALIMNIYKTPVNAQMNQEIGQAQEQEFEVICETGEYGQTTTCRVVGSQEQVQYASQSADVVYIEKDGKLIAVPRHDVVDTSLDMRTMLATSSTLVLGAIATILKIKNRVA